MYVTVYLRDAKKHTVIPHEYIYELVEVNLFNKGINTNQNRRIYFSQDVFDSFKSGESPNLLENAPNFDRPITKDYPLQNGERSACYIARLVKFWSSFHEALEHSNHLRSQMPATYNPARVNEMPIPPVRYTSIQCAENTDDETLEQELAPTPENDFQVKSEFEQVCLDDADVSALDDIFSIDDDTSVANDFDTEQSDENENTASSSNSFDSPDANIEAIQENGDEINQNVEPASGSAPESSSALNKIEKIDDDLEFTYASDADFVPYQVQDGYIIKLNDVLSSSSPFKLNEFDDRMYKVEQRDGFIDVTLSAKAVIGLIKLNKLKRECIGADKHFVKALFISVCRMPRIQAASSLQSLLREGEKDFMKHLFDFRVKTNDVNGLRSASFERLLQISYDEIQKQAI